MTAPQAEWVVGTTTLDQALRHFGAGPFLDVPLLQLPPMPAAPAPVAPAMEPTLGLPDFLAGPPPEPAAAATSVGSTGLPQLPALPANPIDSLMGGAAIPALPGVDQVLQPFTSLLSSFGTGKFSGIDPTSVLQQGSKLLETMMTSGEKAISTLTSVWEGAASTQAEQTAKTATQQGTDVGKQGIDISTITARAQAVVAEGNAKLTLIINEFIATAISMAGLLVTPGGQGALIAMATKYLGNAVAVVTEAQGLLGGLIAEVNNAGGLIKVLGLSGVDPSQVISGVKEVVSPVTDFVKETAEKVTSGESSLLPSADDISTTAAGFGSGLGALGVAGGSGGSGGGGGVGGLGSIPGVGTPPPGTVGAPTPGVPMTGGGMGLPTGLPGSTAAASAGGPMTGGVPPHAAGAAGTARGGEHQRNVQGYSGSHFDADADPAAAALGAPTVRDMDYQHDDDEPAATRAAGASSATAFTAFDGTGSSTPAAPPKPESPVPTTSAGNHITTAVSGTSASPAAPPKAPAVAKPTTTTSGTAQPPQPEAGKGPSQDTEKALYAGDNAYKTAYKPDLGQFN